MKGRERWREKRKKVQRRVKKKGKREAKGQIRDALKLKGTLPFWVKGNNEDTWYGLLSVSLLCQ